MNKAKKILKNIIRLILVLLILYLGYAGLRTYKYNHVYTIEQKLNYICNYYAHTGFPITNRNLLESKIFKENDVKYYPAKSLDPNSKELDFNTQHFGVSCISGGSVIIVNGFYYKNNKLYENPSWKKVDDKKETQLLNKELKEFTDEFGKHMGFQIYNPF